MTISCLVVLPKINRDYSVSIQQQHAVCRESEQFACCEKPDGSWTYAESVWFQMQREDFMEMKLNPLRFQGAEACGFCKTCFFFQSRTSRAAHQVFKVSVICTAKDVGIY